MGGVDNPTPQTKKRRGHEEGESDSSATDLGPRTDDEEPATEAETSAPNPKRPCTSTVAQTRTYAQPNITNTPKSSTAEQSTNHDDLTTDTQACANLASGPGLRATTTLTTSQDFGGGEGGEEDNISETHACPNLASGPGLRAIPTLATSQDFGGGGGGEEATGSGSSTGPKDHRLKKNEQTPLENQPQAKSRRTDEHTSYYDLKEETKIIDIGDESQTDEEWKYICPFEKYEKIQLAKQMRTMKQLWHQSKQKAAEIRRREDQSRHIRPLVSTAKERRRRLWRKTKPEHTAYYRQRVDADHSINSCYVQLGGGEPQKMQIKLIAEARGEDDEDGGVPSQLQALPHFDGMHVLHMPLSEDRTCTEGCGGDSAEAASPSQSHSLNNDKESQAKTQEGVFSEYDLSDAEADAEEEEKQIKRQICKTFLFICPKCHKENDVTHTKLLSDKGFATLSCLKSFNGCGARTSALHWNCKCQDGQSRWYKCPVHSRHQQVVMHRQQRERSGKAKATPNNADDRIPTIRIKAKPEVNLHPKKKRKHQTTEQEGHQVDLSESEQEDDGRPKLDPKECPKLFKRLHLICPNRVSSSSHVMRTESDSMSLYSTAPDSRACTGAPAS